MHAHYGLVDAHYAPVIARSVCDVLGYGSNNNAHVLLCETAAQETRMGFYTDPTPHSAGTGLLQIDEPTFNWLKVSKFERYKDRIKAAFGVDIMVVQYIELKFSPLLSFIVARIRYLIVPDAIPTSVEWRAHYWKEHYNTHAGKGHPSEYIENAVRFAHYIPHEPTNESADF